MADKDLSIVIVNWNTRALLLDCLASVYHTIRVLSFEVFVVDNASRDGSVAAVQEHYPQVKLIQNEENLGFAAANNKALRQMIGRYALLLNTDAVLTEGAVEKLLRFMDSHPLAAMGCGQLLNANGSKQNSIANFPTLLTLLSNESLLRTLMPKKFPSKRRKYTAPIQVESCIGACLMVRKAAMDEVGLLDERYFFFMEETDWARSMKKAGWESWFVPDARTYHLQGQSAGDNIEARKMFYRSRYRYFRKWHGKWIYFVLAIIILRLLINVFINTLCVALTLGAAGNCRNRLGRYLQLLQWHFRDAVVSEI